MSDDFASELRAEIVDLRCEVTGTFVTLECGACSQRFEAYQLTQRLVFILSADRITKEQVATLSNVDEQIAKACREQDITAIRKLNDEFYGIVATGCSNKFLQELYVKLREFSSRLSAMIHKSLIGNDWEAHTATLQRDHEDIIQALSEKNCDTIGGISDQDVALFKQKVYQSLERPIPAGAHKLARGIL